MARPKKDRQIEYLDRMEKELDLIYDELGVFVATDKHGKLKICYSIDSPVMLKTSHNLTCTNLEVKDD